MKYQGNIIKMKSSLTETVEYTLPIGKELVPLNNLIDKKISLTYLNQINCIACGKKTNKSFGQGFCYTCFMEAPESSECILHPDKCKAHLGISRDQKWSENHCLTPHIVYLAVSSNLKVGITRKSQIPTRWIDQGATSAIIIAETPNRHIAGVIEKFLMQFYSDKTSWQSMLKGKTQDIDLFKEKLNAIDHLPLELRKYSILENKLTKIKYPVEQFPTKINSLNFDKTNRVEGILSGIKGQYLFFDENNVINIRRHSGYLLELEVK